jgi:penicillin-binding protein 1A
MSYRAKLAYLELDRLKVDYGNFKTILVDIEDRKYNGNSGFSLRSLTRAAISQVGFFRRRFGYIESGGSTVTMQLARSLFIPANQNRIRRKIIEILLSYWLHNQFTKDEILRLYSASVRYERGVIGLANSLKYFFNELKSKSLTNEEAFFLVERLSNVTSTVSWPRILHLTKRVSIKLDKEKLKAIYDELILCGKLKG